MYPAPSRSRPLVGVAAALLLVCSLACPALLPGAETPPLTWKQCLNQPAAWYGGPEALRVADNVLEFQRDSGGWPKNLDLAAPLSAEARERLRGQRSRTDSTIDNGSTTRPMIFLARVIRAHGTPRCQGAFLRGLDYLLAAQYPNGGWPQFYPSPKGYAAHITFNDDAMVNVMRLLRDVAQRKPDFAFVDEPRRLRAEQAVARAVNCVLDCQVVVRGHRTVWCAQHDERTLAPASARSYEKASLSGSESVGLVRFLMELENPDPRIVAAVEAAVAWFQAAKLTGIRQVERKDPALPGGRDRVIVPDAGAPPLWARFHDIETNRPLFCGRDGVIKYSLAEIEHERRVGYSWYTGEPARLVSEDYPRWRRRQVQPPGVSADNRGMDALPKRQ
jgi:PelA/Pel-15E family pectate lyase